jgi:hypothetical protein
MKGKPEDYKTFRNMADAQEYIDIFKREGIEYVLEKVVPIFDPAFAGHNENEAVILKLYAHDFEQANEVYEKSLQIDINTLDKDYYLFNFTDEDLKEVVIKKDEWNAFDYVLALQLLKSRGITISTEELAKIRKDRQNELAQSKPFPMLKVILGYLFAMFGGLFGIFIGLELIWNSKTLENGTKVYIYDPKARNHGTIIIIIGVITLVFIFISNRIKEYILLNNPMQF